MRSRTRLILRSLRLLNLLFLILIFSTNSLAWSQENVIDESDTNVQALLAREIQRSQPDYIVYKPKSVDGSTFDTGNEHFLVFDGPDGSLIAVWTQSSYEGAGDHRIVFSRSEDEGKTWSDPVVVATVPPNAKGTYPRKEVSYPYAFERRPGEIWLTTWRGAGLRVKLFEKDFVDAD